MIETLGAVGLGSLAGVVSYTIARLVLNGKYPSRTECRIRHDSLDKQLEQIVRSLERIEEKLDQHVSRG